ncbi:RNA helicase required for poly(A+) mRNA export [Mortierella sp. AD032]|nr:RNA helicase required for poly(A+) mRNA export [Mortierella sp. AD032]
MDNNAFIQWASGGSGWLTDTTTPATASVNSNNTANPLPVTSQVSDNNISGGSSNNAFDFSSNTSNGAGAGFNSSNTVTGSISNSSNNINAGTGYDRKNASGFKSTSFVTNNAAGTDHFGGMRPSAFTTAADPTTATTTATTTNSATLSSFAAASSFWSAAISASASTPSTLALPRVEGTSSSMPVETSPSAPVETNSASIDSQMQEAMSELNASYDVHVIQQDQSSPYHSISSFEDLHLSESLLKGLYMKRFDRPSKIQEHALPLLLKNPPENLIAQAQSGTGKTAAFCLAILSRLNLDDPATQAIILSPTRELTLQTVDVMKELARYTNATIATAVLQIDRQYSNVNGHVVIGTPGTVDRLIKTRKMNVSKVAILVLDEADSMVNMQSLGQICDQIRKQVNEVRLLKPEELAIQTIHQFYIDCADEEDRFSILCDLYSVMTISKSIIFVQTRVTADKITERLINKHHQVSFLHGNLSPQERDQRMDDFRQTRTKVLVATDVLSRGIDVCDVNMVINYDLPTTLNFSDRSQVADPELYLHRIGRTGRFGRRGVAINFVHSSESYEVLENINSKYGCDIHKIVTDWEHLEGDTEHDKKMTRLDNIEVFIKNTLKGT